MNRFTFAAWDTVVRELQAERERLLVASRQDATIFDAKPWDKRDAILRVARDVDDTLTSLRRIWSTD